MERLNDEERRQWVLNDEGLYRRYIADGGTERGNIRAWIRKNRALIDEVVGNIRSGRKQAHYLVYGG